jgi:uncharacterized protein (TIGR02145 family)
LNLRSYYCYDDGKGHSDIVSNPFAKAMEDSLTRSFIVENDSTGNAHLSYIGTEFKDPFNSGFLKQYGAQDYCYSNCVTSFTDERDGITYRAVCIGKQNWMAENLRFNAPGSVFYDDNPANGPIYGKLYDWSTVMNGASSTNANPSGVQGICPKGWHVPSSAEWDYLNLVSIGNKGSDLKDTNYWKSPNLGATDRYGFSARGGGFYNTKYDQLNIFGWWATTHGLNNGVEVYQLQSWTNPLLKINAGFSTKVSCRCVKD